MHHTKEHNLIHFTPHRRDWCGNQQHILLFRCAARKRKLCRPKPHITRIVAHLFNTINGNFALAKANEKPAFPHGLKSGGLRRVPKGHQIRRPRTTMFSAMPLAARSRSDQRMGVQCWLAHRFRHQGRFPQASSVRQQVAQGRPTGKCHHLHHVMR